MERQPTSLGVCVCAHGRFVPLSLNHHHYKRLTGQVRPSVRLVPSLAIYSKWEEKMSVFFNGTTDGRVEPCSSFFLLLFNLSSYCHSYVLIGWKRKAEREREEGMGECGSCQLGPFFDGIDVLSISAISFFLHFYLSSFSSRSLNAEITRAIMITTRRSKCQFQTHVFHSFLPARSSSNFYKRVLIDSTRQWKRKAFFFLYWVWSLQFSTFF